MKFSQLRRQVGGRFTTSTSKVGKRRWSALAPISSLGGSLITWKAARLSKVRFPNLERQKQNIVGGALSSTQPSCRRHSPPLLLSTGEPELHLPTSLYPCRFSELSVPNVVASQHLAAQCFCTIEVPTSHLSMDHIHSIHSTDPPIPACR